MPMTGLIIVGLASGDLIRETEAEMRAIMARR
jgi:hypothetical protein